MKHLFKCKVCGVYTMKEECPRCGQKTIRPVPPKYSPIDKYGAYRRKVKFESLKKADFI